MQHVREERVGGEVDARAPAGDEPEAPRDRRLPVGPPYARLLVHGLRGPAALVEHARESDEEDGHGRRVHQDLVVEAAAVGGPYRSATSVWAPTSPPTTPPTTMPTRPRPTAPKPAFCGALKAKQNLQLPDPNEPLGGQRSSPLASPATAPTAAPVNRPIPIPWNTPVPGLG